MLKSLYNFDHFIPLGDHCGPSIILKRLKIRKESYPFDWITHVDPVENSMFSTIYEIMINLLKKNNIKKIVDSLFGDCFENNFLNSKNLVSFPHERGTNKNSIIKKYYRRFKRLYDNINDNSKNMYIIMHRNSEIDFKQLSHLAYLLKTYNFDSEIILFSGKYKFIPINPILVKCCYYRYDRIIGDQFGYDRFDRELFYTYFRNFLHKKVSKVTIFHKNNDLKCNNKILIKKNRNKCKYKCCGHNVDNYSTESILMLNEDININLIDEINLMMNEDHNINLFELESGKKEDSILLPDLNDDNMDIDYFSELNLMIKEDFNINLLENYKYNDISIFFDEKPHFS